MKVSPLKGKYVLAVSGGVDSVVLLDLLSSQKGDLDIVVAHFDHGIRTDSALDNELVENLAKKHGYKFYSKQGKLGAATSEQKAREARYGFLNSVVSSENADGLITAHHQDDLIETAIINIIRGTGRKGLSSLNSSKVTRPLLSYPKSEIRDYAKAHGLNWREDSTNTDIKYLRNYIRHNIVPRLNGPSRKHLVELIKRQTELNNEIDSELTNVLKTSAKDNSLPRLWLNSLDNSLSREVLATWLRQNGLADFDRSTIERLASDLKTVGPNKKIDVLNNWQVSSSSDNLALKHVER